MKHSKIIIFTLFIFLHQNLFAQTATYIPPANQNYAGLEKNMLFNAHVRFTVTQTGTRNFNAGNLFNARYEPEYIAGFDGDPANAVSIEIANLPDLHIQNGGYVGFCTRQLPPKRFKIEGFDSYHGNIWKTLAEETNNSQNYYSAWVTDGSYTKLRFTFYEATELSGYYSGWIGLSELFFLHGEAAKAYDGLMVQYSTNGSVGIGTDNPDANFKLSVNGKVRVKEIKVESNWADFVFKPDYNLMSLAELESYINSHQHLPGVPDEKTIQKQGVNLGEAQTLLLQKIEELTLYLLQQNKKIEQQNKKIEMQQQEMEQLKNRK